MLGRRKAGLVQTAFIRTMLWEGYGDETKQWQIRNSVVPGSGEIAALANVSQLTPAVASNQCLFSSTGIDAGCEVGSPLLSRRVTIRLSFVDENGDI
jgi:hypothetical protein